MTTSALAMIIVFYAHDYIGLWTGQQEIASAISSTAVLLTLGSMFLSLQLCPYYLALANGHTRTNVLMGAGSIVAIVPLLWFLIPAYGLLGAAIPWLVINITATLLLGVIIIRKYLKNEFFAWLLKDSFLPVAVSFAVGLPLYFVFGFLPAGAMSVVYGAVIASAAVAVNGYLFVRKYPEMLSNRIVSKIVKKTGIRL